MLRILLTKAVWTTQSTTFIRWGFIYLQRLKLFPQQNMKSGHKRLQRCLAGLFCVAGASVWPEIKQTINVSSTIPAPSFSRLQASYLLTQAASISADPKASIMSVICWSSSSTWDADITPTSSVMSLYNKVKAAFSTLNPSAGEIHQGWPVPSGHLLLEAPHTRTLKGDSEDKPNSQEGFYTRLLPRRSRRVFVSLLDLLRSQEQLWSLDSLMTIISNLKCLCLVCE